MMFRLVFSILAFLLLFSPAIAQIQLNGEHNVFYGSASNPSEELDVVWDVINASDFTLNLRCKRIAYQQVPNTDGNFCWGWICTPWTTAFVYDPDEVVTLPPGEQTSTFHAKYRHHGNEGQSIFNYCFYDTNNLVDELCYKVNFCVDGECETSSPLSVKNEEKLTGEIVQISPNPIEKIGNISYKFSSAPRNGKLNIYNMIGAKVKEVSLSNSAGMVLISASDFESGIYFCNIEDSGKIFQTVRLVIQ